MMLLLKKYNRAQSFFPLVLSCRNISRKKQVLLTDLVQKKPEDLRRHQIYDYFIVLDFEATCERSKLTYDQEIIEFPAFKVNSSTYQIEECFHSFVRPTIQPILSEFCMQLTGITQFQVDDKPTLKEVMQLFDIWMEKHVLSDNKNFIFCTSGDWDLMKMLPSECKMKNLTLPKYFYPYVNINKSYALTMGKWPRLGKGRLHAMLRLLDLEVFGELHQGTSDCENMIRIMEVLSKKGHIFKPTSTS
ncbi:ERI1 exoribonuclease 3-like [Styela clava]|uniref:ERI1 exoribonuclease 3-like n=1 Tax=Styela clava TaxID=7725 RepID=UPI00193A5906|nr:ERI1 exoribonuclease 3-like [Styela clava]